MKNKITISIKGQASCSMDSHIILNSSNYIVEEFQLGSGGNGAVYKCQEQVTGEEYAIKFLLADSRKNKLRFEREIKFLQECVKHNHITSYIDSGVIKATNKKGKNIDIHFCIMELAEGGNLQEYIASQSPMGFLKYAAQFRGLADALKYMHDQGALHRDIKPENILIMGERWVLSDFGLIAPIERDGVIGITGDANKIGPVFWMSPEATNKCLGVSGEYAEIKEHSDVFQLASVFWFIVNKRHPSGILKESDWSGKKEIYDVVQKSLQHNPAERYLNGATFFDAIVGAIES